MTEHPDQDQDQGPGPGPGFAIPTGLLAALEGALNQYIRMDPEGARGFERIYGRIIGIAIDGLGARLTLIPGPDRVQVFGAYDATPDCLIRGTPLALLRLLTSERKDAPVTSGAVRIEGDTAVAQGLSEALGGLAIDWEEQLARLLGDPIAAQLGSAMRAAGDWGRRTGESARGNVREYLQEESRLLPTRYEVEEFLRAVDDLRDDCERLAARIAHLGTIADARDTRPRQPR